MNNSFPVWFLLAVGAQSMFSLNAIAQTQNTKVVIAAPEIIGVKSVSVGLPMAARLVTYSRNAEQTHKAPQTQAILSIELLTRNWSNSHKKYKNPVDVKQLSLGDLAKKFPYTVSSDARIEAVLEKSRGYEKPPKMSFRLRIDGIHPVGTTDPYLLQCQVPVHKNKLGTVDCQSIAQAN